MARRVIRLRWPERGALLAPVNSSRILVQCHRAPWHESSSTVMRGSGRAPGMPTGLWYGQYGHGAGMPTGGGMGGDGRGLQVETKLHANAVAAQWMCIAGCFRRFQNMRRITRANRKPDASSCRSRGQGGTPRPSQAIHGPADRHLHILDVPTSQTGPQEPLTVAHHPQEPVDHHQSTPPSSLGIRGG